MRRIIFILFLMVCTTIAQAQQPVSDLYQYNLTSINSSFAGVDGSKVAAMGSLQVPDRGELATYGFVGFETTFPGVPIGFGFSASTHQIGYATNSYLNVFGSYQLELPDKSKLVFGLKLSDNQQGINFGAFLPIDPSDPLIGSSGTQKASFLKGGA